METIENYKISYLDMIDPSKGTQEHLEYVKDNLLEVLKKIDTLNKTKKKPYILEKLVYSEVITFKHLSLTPKNL